MHGSNRQLVSSLTSRKLTRQLGNMISNVNFIGLVLEADCMFLSPGISGTAEFESK